jgi:hypothetical protein
MTGKYSTIIYNTNFLIYKGYDRDKILWEGKF